VKTFSVLGQEMVD